MENKSISEPSAASLGLIESNSKKSEDSKLNYRQLTGVLVERKRSQEELIERQKWMQQKRSKISLTARNRSRVVHIVQFSDKLSGLYSARFSSNGEIIATSFGSGSIQLRNGDSGELRSTIRSGLESSLPATCCRFHPTRKDTIYVSSACGNIFQCKVDEVQFWKFAEELDNEINCIDINVTGSHIASVGKDAGLRVYDAETAQLLKKYKCHKDELISEIGLKYHDMRLYAVKCHPVDSNILVTGGWDDTIKVWDLRSRNGCTKTLYGPHICGEAIDLHQSKVLTGSYTFKNSLQLWDMSSGKLIETINPINREPSSAGEYLYSASFFDGDPFHGHVIVGGSATGCVEIINLKENMVVAQFDAKKTVMTIDSQYTNIVYGGSDSSINLARFN